MSKVAKLHKARKAKNDEFYTLYEDVEKEISNYVDYNPNVFKDKVILCPCDDPTESAFFKVFCCYFSQWKIKKLICTSYNKGGNGKKLVLDRDIDLNGDGKITKEDLVIGTFQGNSGDFKSDAITKLRDQCDIIITNPPFSIFGDFFKWCVDSKKQFLCITGLDKVTSSVIFPHIWKNKVWFGTGTNMYFNKPVIGKNGKPVIGKNGKKILQKQLMLFSCWMTNLPYDRTKKPLQLLPMQTCKYTYGHRKDFKDAYIKYDNVDAIEVPLVRAIPSDYKGLMGVPPSFLIQYNPDQFEIVGLGSNGGKFLSEMKINSKKFIDALNKQKQDEGKKPTFKYGKKILGYFKKDGTAKSSYYRIIIRHKV